MLVCIINLLVCEEGQGILRDGFFAVEGYNASNCMSQAIKAHSLPIIFLEYKPLNNQYLLKHLIWKKNYPRWKLEILNASSHTVICIVWNKPVMNIELITWFLCNSFLVKVMLFLPSPFLQPSQCSLKLKGCVEYNNHVLCWLVVLNSSQNQTIFCALVRLSCIYPSTIYMCTEEASHSYSVVLCTTQ